MTEVAAAGAGPGTALRRLLGPARAFSAVLAAEGERRLLWLPVFFGSGIAVYFALTVEPWRWLGLVAIVPPAALAVVLRRRPALCEACIALAFAAAGLAAVQQARVERGTPMLTRRLRPLHITGKVVDIDARRRGWRIVVAPDPLKGLMPGEQPRLVRIHIAADSDRLLPGDRLRVLAKLFPPPPQVVPGGRDLQRELFFMGIGAVGYSYGAAHRVAPAGAPAAPDSWADRLLRLRTEMTRRINRALPGSTGGVASAVITGKRGMIAENVAEAFREAGLAHLLAIAGLHLGLVGGFVFFVVRGGLALIPPLALRLPIKKIAAGATLLALFCYLLISGARIPTERAFVMNGIVFAAILIDRLRISMRICAIAALVVLLCDPSSLVGVSFQMSFGAVMALIAVYERWGSRLARLFHQGSPLRQIAGYAGAVAVTTVVATLGIEPFAIYHFHRIILYSPLANVIAVPISAMWTLPWGVVACLLMPLGLEKLALVPMGWGIDATIHVAQWVAALPGNLWQVPRLPTWGVVLIAFGGCWLCLWQGRWRRWGLLGIAAGLAGLLVTRPPDIVLADFGRLLAARAADGSFYTTASAEKLPRAFLREETGEALRPWPAAGARAGTGTDRVLDCARPGRCFYTARGRRVALVTSAAGLPVACDTVDAIVAQVPAGFACRGRIPVADRIDNWRYGAIALWLGRDGVTLVSANRSRGDRPWVPHPISRRERARRRARAAAAAAAHRH